MPVLLLAAVLTAASTAGPIPTASAADPAPITVPADWGLIPKGLKPGDRFRLLITTSEKTKAVAKPDKSGKNISTYNTFVQNLVKSGHADIQEHSSDFRAVGCTAATSAKDNTYTTGTGEPIYWLNGNKVADYYADFYDGSWDEEADPRNENGATANASGIHWTGCNDDGTKRWNRGGLKRATLGSEEILDSQKRKVNGTGQLNTNSNSPLGDRSQLEGKDRTNNYLPYGTPYPMYGLSPVFTIDNTAPVVVSLLSDEEWVLPEDSSIAAQMAVSLSRPLTAEERVDAPLVIFGVQVGDYTLSASGTGVSATNASTLSPVIKFDGAGAQSALISITPTKDTADEGIAETLTIALGNDAAFDDSTLGTNVSAGADPHDTDTSAKVVIVDSGLWRPVMPSDSGLIPSGVQAGEKFRLIIATSVGTAATSSDIATYNAWVQGLVANGHAGIRPYASAFTALGSTATTDARDNTHTTGTGVPIYWLGGSKVADDYADFYDESWDDETNPRNENGSAVSPGSYWTGSNHDGTKHPLYRLGFRFAVRGILNGSDADQSPLYGGLTLSISSADRPGTMFAISPVFVAGRASEAVAGFANSEFEVTEGDSGTFDATYAGSTGANGSFTVVVTDGTAAMETDFFLATPSTGSAEKLTPDAGASSSIGLELFTTPDDSADTPDRSFTAQIAATSGNLKIGAADQATFTIIDNDPTIVSLSGSGSLAEGSSTTVDLTVTLGRALVDGERIDVPLVVSGTGVDNSDYRLTKKSGTGAKLTGAASNKPIIEFEGGGAQTAVLTVAVKDDKVDEELETETLTIALGNDAAFDHADLGTTVGGGADPHGTVNSSEITIADNDDPQVNLSRSDSLITEGANATITATLTELLEENITVHLEPVADKSEGKITTDYKISFDIDIPAGSWSGTGIFDSLEDKEDEPAETVRIAISDKTTGVDKGVNRYVNITIDDNDPTVVSLTGGGTVEEGSTDTAEITVALGRELEDGYEAVKVPLAISGTGITSADFTLELKEGSGINHRVTLDNAAPLAPTVRFNKGAQTAILLLSAPSDDNNEGTSETLAIALGNQAAFDDLIGESIIESTTVDGGAAPHSTDKSASVSITEAPLAGVSVSESGNPANTSVAENGGTDTYTVVLDSQPASSVTVTATSAVPGAAKVHASGGSPAASAALTFTTSNWNQAQTITVTGQNDDIDNTGDQRTAAISHAVTTGDGGDYPTDLTIDPVTATVTDDDDPPTGIILTASPTTVAEDAGDTTVTVTAQVNGTTRYADAKTVTVSVAGHDTAGKVQFTPVTNFDITIPAGQTSQTNTFDLTPTDDSTDTADGQASVTGTMTGGGSVTSTTIAVTDDDATPTAITLSVDDNSVAEGDSGTTINVTATVVGSTRFGVAKTVTVSVAGKADTSSVNYVDMASVVDFDIVIPAGAASHTGSFTLTPSDDVIDETDNTVTVSGSITGDSAVTVNSATITLADDDATPTGVILTVDNNSVAEDGSNTTITVTATVDGSTRFGVPKTVAVSVAGHDASNKVKFAAVSDFNIVIAAGAASNTGQFPLNPTDDARATADGEASVTGTVTGDGSVTVTATSVTVANDDEAPAAITATLGVNNSGSVTEGSTLTVTVNLGSNAATNLSVPVRMQTSGSPTASSGDFTLSNSGSVAITSGTNSGTITFTAVDDKIDEDSESLTLEFGSLPAELTAGSPNTAAVTITDNDTAGVTVIETGTPADTTVEENEGEDTYTVVLDSKPLKRVIIRVDAELIGDNIAARVEKNNNGNRATYQDLTFTPSNWNQPKTITVRGVNNNIDDPGDKRTVTITHTVREGDNGKYTTSTSISDVTVTVTDDDSGAGVSVSTGAVSVAENGGTDTYTVVLDSQPASNVTVTATSAAPGAARVHASGRSPAASAELTFTTSNWSQPQTITVTGQNDNIDNTANQRTAAISHAVTTGDSGNYPTSLTIAPVTATVTDDDAAPTGITLTASPTTVAEDAGNTTVTVTARVNGTTRYADAKTVTVSVAGHNTNGKVQFTPVTNFDITIPAGAASQTDTFDLAPTDDASDTANGEASLTGTVTGGGSVTPATITITDDDGAGVSVSNGAVSVAEGGGTASYRVVLDSQPAASVTVTATSDTPGAAKVHASGGSPAASAALTFTTSNWSQAQTITVTGQNDNIDNTANQRTSAISHAVTTGDSGNYPTSLTIAPVTATVTDDDAAPTGITLTASPTTVAEDAGNTTVTVTARVNGTTRYPDDKTVTVSVAGHNTNGKVAFTQVNNFDITIPAGQASRTHTFTLTPTDDSTDTADGEASVTGTVTSGASVTVTATTITITDDDLGAKPKVTLSINGSGGTTEGGARTITATLDQVLSPAAAVTIPIRRSSGSSASTSDYSLASSITIASGARTGSTTLSTSNDSADEPTETLRIQLGTLPSTVIAGSTTSVTATIYDNDPTAVSLARSGTGTISETSGKAVITVSLGRSLLSSERIDVPLRISGTGITAADYTLSLRSGSNLNTGVSLRSANTTSPVLRFSGRGARTATLDLAATDDRVDEGASETLAIALGTNSAFDRQTSTNVGGGADPHRTVNRTLIVINDNDQTASAQSGESDEISGSNPLVVSVGAASPTSVDEGHSTLIPISMNEKSSTPMAITISVIGNADPDTDFTVALSDPGNPGHWQQLWPQSGLINIVLDPGDTYSTLQLNALADEQSENPEGVLVSISALEAIGGSDRKAITVGAASVAIYDPGTRPEPSSTSQSTGQNCYDIFGFGYGDWYSPDGQSCVLVNYFPNTHPAHGNAVKAWIQEHPDQYQQYLDQTSTGSQTTTQALNATQPVAQLLAAGRSCYEIFGFGYGDWYSPDRQSCVLVNYFPNTHPAHGNAVKAWIQEHPDQYQQYLDQTS